MTTRTKPEYPVGAEAQSPAYWSQILDDVPELISVHDTECRIIRVNKALANVLKKTPEEMVGKPCYLLQTARGSNLLDSCACFKAITTGKAIQEELHDPFLGLDLHVSTTPVPDPKGQVTRVIRIAHDVTPWKQTEKTLRTQQERLELALKGSQEGLWDWNAQTGQCWYSTRWKEMLGYSEEEVSHYISTWTKMIHPEDIDRVLKTLGEIFRNGHEYKIEFRIKHKKGHYVHILSRGYLVRQGERGPVVRIVGTHFDLTETKHKEAELQRLYQSEKRLREKLESEINRRVSFTRALVHELKTCLTPLMAASELFEVVARGKQDIMLSQTINSSVKGLDHRVDELLDLARGEVGLLKLKCKWIDPFPLLKSIRDQARIEAIRNGQHFSSYISHNLPQVWGDEDRISQMVLNLLVNAIRYNSKGGRVGLRCLSQSDRIIIKVSDTGPGLSDEQLAHIFEPYRSIEKKGRKISGLGLGLPLTKIFVDLHGGKISVNCIKDKGSIFTIILPLQAVDKLKKKGYLREDIDN